MKETNGKKTYDSIEIPEELNDMVRKTIASRSKEDMKKMQNVQKIPKKHPFGRFCGIAAAAVLGLAAALVSRSGDKP